MSELTIGILGGGQLAMMMTEAAKEMGYKVYVLDPTPKCPASYVGAIQTVGSFRDKKDIHNFIKITQIDVLTYDIESINTGGLLGDSIEPNIKIHPTPVALSIINDKLCQHEFYEKYDFSHEK